MPSDALNCTQQPEGEDGESAEVAQARLVRVSHPNPDADGDAHRFDRQIVRRAWQR